MRFEKYTPNVSKARVSSKPDIYQMPRPIDRAVLQRFVEKKRFLKKITKQRVLIKMKVQQKIQILEVEVK